MAAVFDQPIGRLARQIPQHRLNRFANGLDGRLTVALRAAQRFGDNTVNHAQFLQILRGQAQRFGRLAHFFGIFPQDRCAAFGRDHGINRMFQHGDAVGRGKGHRAARPAFTNDDRHHRHAYFQTFGGGPRNRLGLPPLLGTFTRVCTGGIDQRDHRQAKPMRQIHQPHSLAVPFGPRHAEITFNARFGIIALFLANHHHRQIVKPRQPAHHGVVIGKASIPCQQGEFFEQRFDIIFGMGAVRMARDLAFLPRGQGFIHILQHHARLAIQPFGFFGNIHRRVGPRHRAQLFGLAFDFRQGLFKLEVVHQMLPLFGPICAKQGQSATGRAGG